MKTNYLIAIGYDGEMIHVKQTLDNIKRSEVALFIAELEKIKLDLLEMLDNDYEVEES